MKKRLFALVMAVLCLLSLTGCGSPAELDEGSLYDTLAEYYGKTEVQD